MNTTIAQSGASPQQIDTLYSMINDSPGASGVSDPSDSTADGSSVYLTPDALMVYIQSRLGGIDSQVKAAMLQQQNTNWEQSGIQSILTELSNDSNAIPSSDNGIMKNGAECQQLAQNIEDLITKIQTQDPGCSALGQLESLHDAVMATGSGTYTDSSGTFHGYYAGGDPMQPPTGTTPPPNINADHDGEIGPTEFTSFTNTLNGVASSLSSGAELQMINIQSLMSQRTTAIQLTTSILQAYDDGLSKITDNIGK